MMRMTVCFDSGPLVFPQSFVQRAVFLIPLNRSLWIVHFGLSTLDRPFWIRLLTVGQSHYALLTFPKNSCKKFCLIGFLSLTVTCTAIFFGGKHDLFVPIVGIVPQNQSVTKMALK